MDIQQMLDEHMAKFEEYSKKGRARQCDALLANAEAKIIAALIAKL